MLRRLAWCGGRFLVLVLLLLLLRAGGVAAADTVATDSLYTLGSSVTIHDGRLEPDLLVVPTGRPVRFVNVSDAPSTIEEIRTPAPEPLPVLRWMLVYGSLVGLPILLAFFELVSGALSSILEPLVQGVCGPSRGRRMALFGCVTMVYLVGVAAAGFMQVGVALADRQEAAAAYQEQQSFRRSVLDRLDGVADEVDDRLVQRLGEDGRGDGLGTGTAEDARSGEPTEVKHGDDTESDTEPGGGTEAPDGAGAADPRASGGKAGAESGSGPGTDIDEPGSSPAVS